MATQTINFPFLAGETGYSLRLLSLADRSIIATQSASESTENNGVQTAAFTDVPAGQYLLQLIKSTDVWGNESVTLTLTTAQFWPDAVIGGSGGGGSGTGARTVTITVNDGTSALQNATVRLTEGINAYTAITNVSGVCTFNVDDATYTVSISKSGYTYAGTTLVVDGTETRTYSMTAIVVTPGVAPLCTVVIHIQDQYGNDLSGEPVEITFIEFTEDATETPPVLSVPPVQESDADGLVEVTLYRNAKYKAVYGTYPYSRRIDFTVPDAGSYEVQQ
jgi:hypothetical protein